MSTDKPSKELTQDEINALHAEGVALRKEVEARCDTMHKKTPEQASQRYWAARAKKAEAKVEQLQGEMEKQKKAAIELCSLVEKSAGTYEPGGRILVEMETRSYENLRDKALEGDK